MSQMFAVAKLAGMACKVKPERPRQRETELGGSDTHNLRWRAGIGSKHADLNYSNRPVRTRMPGGVGGARSGILTAPIPIVLKVRLWPRLRKNSPFSKIAKIFTTLTKIVMYMLAGYATPWQYCSSSRFNSPLLKITFCFHTASAELRSTVIITTAITRVC